MISLKLNLQIVRSLQMSPDYTGSPFYPKEPPMYANVCNPWQQEFHFDWCVDYNLEGAFVIWYFFAQAEWSLDHPSPVCPPAKEHIQVPCCQDSLVHYKGQDNREFLVGGGFVAATSGSSCFLHVTQCNKFDIKALCHAKRWYKLLQNAANIWMFCLRASRGLRDCKDGIVRVPEESFAFGGSAPSSVSFSSVHEILPIKFVLSHAVTSLICWISGTRPNGRRSRWNGGDSRVQSWWDAWKSARMTEVLEYWERHWNMMKHVWMCLCNIYRFRHIRGHAGIVWYVRKHNTMQYIWFIHFGILPGYKVIISQLHVLRKYISYQLSVQLQGKL